MAFMHPRKLNPECRTTEKYANTVTQTVGMRLHYQGPPGDRFRKPERFPRIVLIQYRALRRFKIEAVGSKVPYPMNVPVL